MSSEQKQLNGFDWELIKLSDAYEEAKGTHRKGTLNISWPKLKAFFRAHGIDPMRTPDEIEIAHIHPNCKNVCGDKVDISFAIEITNPSSGDEVMLIFWNYKNGPSYSDCDEPRTLNDIDEFSVWWSDSSLGLAPIESFIDEIEKLAYYYDTKPQPIKRDLHFAVYLDDSAQDTVNGPVLVEVDSNGYVWSVDAYYDGENAELMFMANDEENEAVPLGILNDGHVRTPNAEADMRIMDYTITLEEPLSK